MSRQVVIPSGVPLASGQMIPAGKGRRSQGRDPLCGFNEPEISSGIHSTILCTLPLEEKSFEIAHFFLKMVRRLNEAFAATKDVELLKPIHAAIEPAAIPGEKEISKEKRDAVMRSAKVAEAVDFEMNEICRQQPELNQKNSIVRTGPQVYIINGRTVDLFVLLEGTATQRVGQLLVRDGPLVQPFLDYIFNTGLNEEYDQIELPTTQRLDDMDKKTLPSLPLPAEHMGQTADNVRVEAMQFAKRESEIRDKSAMAKINGLPGGWRATGSVIVPPQSTWWADW